VHLLSAAELSNRNGEPTDVYPYGDALHIRLETNAAVGHTFGLEFRIKNWQRQPVAYASSSITRSERFRAGDTLEVTLPVLRLAEGTYSVDFVCRLPGLGHLDVWPEDVSFTVVDARPGASPVNVRASDELGSVVLEETRFETS
jgi:hypothetical protein